MPKGERRNTGRMIQFLQLIGIFQIALVDDKHGIDAVKSGNGGELVEEYTDPGQGVPTR